MLAGASLYYAPARQLAAQGPLALLGAPLYYVPARQLAVQGQLALLDAPQYYAPVQQLAAPDQLAPLLAEGALQAGLLHDKHTNPSRNQPLRFALPTGASPLASIKLLVAMQRYAEAAMRRNAPTVRAQAAARKRFVTTNYKVAVVTAPLIQDVRHYVAQRRRHRHRVCYRSQSHVALKSPSRGIR